MLTGLQKKKKCTSRKCFKLSTKKRNTLGKTSEGLEGFCFAVNATGLQIRNAGSKVVADQALTLFRIERFSEKKNTLGKTSVTIETLKLQEYLSKINQTMEVLLNFLYTG
jgi:hypothetical protein